MQERFVAHPQRKVRYGQLELPAELPSAATTNTDIPTQRFPPRAPVSINTEPVQTSTWPFIFVGASVLGVLGLAFATGYVVAGLVVLGTTTVLIGALVAGGIHILNNTPAGW